MKKCLWCGGPILKEHPLKYKFCSPECKKQHQNKKLREDDAFHEHRRNWQRERRQKDLLALPEEHRVQCLDCGKWYVQLCTHVIQVHGYESAREYKEHHDLETSKGVVPKWYTEEKGETAIENGTYKNLEKGAHRRFKKGDRSIGRYKRSHVTIEKFKKRMWPNKKVSE